MTDEQIKQNAEEWVKPLIGAEDGGYSENSVSIALMKNAFIEGAHSRDKEIEELKNEASAIMDEASALKIQLDKLRNPWISVKDRLPETGADIIYLMNSGTPGRYERYRKFDAEWFRMNVRHWQYANDPELKKGGKK